MIVLIKDASGPLFSLESQSAFPRPNGMSSFWRSQTGELDEHRSTPELPNRSDVVIVGAGYSGAALATHLLAKRGDRIPSILVLEARQLCSGATGRNDGHLKPDSYYSIARLAKEYGLEAAAEVANFEAANFEAANVDAVADFIRDQDIDCDFVLTRAIDGVEATKKTYCSPPEFAERLSGVKGAKGCFSYTAGHLWPYNLTHHAFRKAVEGGAAQVVMATNAYTAAVLPEYKDRIIPYRAICSRITTTAKAPHLANSYALRFDDWDFDYLIPRPDGSIIVGGARQAYVRHLEDWYGSTNDAELIKRARHYFNGYMQRHFYGWESSGARVDDVWTGIMGYSSDRIPRLGPIPDRPGVFILGGFTADSGIPRIFQESKERLQDSRNLVLEIYEKPLKEFASNL
ncbi:hypothetical protein B0J13DRAFT_592120 [Dactylonectria estremocensis]|uniref:FAD dependent oxidoreductase domain-containing protein n=1 Tax=Dactylonectria estremocensis TaxID=1079267 RepID=A0A9P9JHP5_9HYPO|nr:hypothetical protein B0J13DRAFT_592120 [Dactylonectria estremocensis]